MSENVFWSTATSSSTVTIRVGDTVTWVWAGGLPHGVVAGTCTGGGGYYGTGGGCDATGEFQSGSHMAPFEYSRTFTQAGSFRYFCAVHDNAMTGRVVVSNP